MTPSVPHFFLGAQSLNWIAKVPRRWFVSYSQIRRRLRDSNGRRRIRATLPRAAGPNALDSSGFSILSKHCDWSSIPAEQYARDADFYCREVGQVEFVIPQDWMCELPMIEKTGTKEPGGEWPDRRTAIRAHQERTLRSYLELRDLAPNVPWAVALQGYYLHEYLEHLEMYKPHVPREIPRIVLGSMCKRSDTSEGAAIAHGVATACCTVPVHLLGYKAAGLPQVRGVVASADSMAWSDIARTRWYIHEGCRHGEYEFRPRLGRVEHGNCASCLRWALWWADDVERAAAGLPRQQPPGVSHARNTRRAA